VRQAAFFDPPSRGIDVGGVAVDAENSTGRGHQFRGDDRDVAAARPTIKHIHAGADAGRSEQPFRRRAQRISLGCEALAFLVGMPPGVLPIHKTKDPTAVPQDLAKRSPGSRYEPSRYSSRPASWVRDWMSSLR
jgi:hypothetical protein